METFQDFRAQQLLVKLHCFCRNRWDFFAGHLLLSPVDIEPAGICRSVAILAIDTALALLLLFFFFDRIETIFMVSARLNFPPGRHNGVVTVKKM